MEMTKFNNEQIIAAAFCLKGWHKFSLGFLYNANRYSWKILPTMNAFWYLGNVEESCKQLAKLHPSLFKYENNFLTVIGEQQLIYDCFLSGYYPETLEGLASFISCITD